MHNPLADKTALITGGSRRVGRAIALKLAQAGMDVAITFNTSKDPAHQTVTRIRAMGRRAQMIQVNLAHPHGAQQIYDAFISQFDRLDALVNNASVYTPTPLDTITPDSFEHHMAVNALAPLMLTQKFTPMLEANYLPHQPTSTGRIINLTDAQLSHPYKGFTAYNASKAALAQITLATALELAPKITVNAIAPGIVAWPPSHTPEQQERCLARVPLARPGCPNNVATAALYLIRDAHYCTGQVISLDGGRSLA